MSMEAPKAYNSFLGIISCLGVFLLSFFSGWLVGGCTKSKSEPIIKEKIVRDTTLVIKVDTLVLTKIHKVEERVVDTVYVSQKDTSKNSFPIPISEYRFQEDGVYDIIARGYNVSIPSVTVYPKSETKYITTTIEREVESRRWGCYLGGGIYAFNGKVAPMIGLSVKSPNRWLLSGNVGVCDSKIVGGASLYYRLGKN